MNAGAAGDEPVARAFLSQRLRLNYVDWGNPSAPTLLLVHGGEDHCRSWDWIARHFRRDWHVVAMDLRGHGDSEWSGSGDYGVPGYVADLAALVEHLGPRPVTLVGHSLGGNVCLRYAGIFPERVSRLASIEGIGPSPKVQQEREAVSAADALRHWIAERTRLARRNDIRLASLEAAYSRLHQKNAHLSREQAWHLARHAVRAHADGTVNWKFDYLVMARVPYDLTPDQQASLWARIGCPTLLIWGTQTWVSNPQVDGRLRHFRHARVEVLEGAGHWVHHDRLDAVIGLLAGHLAG
jgi:pimeloyl-ACP methyl ester carboxylesterase